MEQLKRARRRRTTPGDAQWFKDAIIYELHVRSFQDSNGDGVGDFPGLTHRLPYLQDLGVTALWLLPFYPSPLHDDGYDIADYTGVHPDYGTLGDFRRFLDAAHELGLRVITELVVNHTSDQHAWFQRARHAAPGTAERNFYVWGDSPERYEDTRIIFSDFESSNWSWDPVAHAYFWHRFYSHQPDLNYDNPAVFDAVVAALDHWFRLGVDGMRLDAVPYLVEREGTHSENLRSTHTIVKRLRAHVDREFGDRIFIAEANQWPEDAAAYFGDGDESHMVFHFPLMPRLFMAIRQEDRLPVVDILEQTPAAPDGCQWALFLRNHDELTLEMVTEEERLYMLEVYATDARARINLGIRHRLAPLLGNDRRRIELMNALLFSLQGTPVLYYGDEIGMGDNIYLGDRNGVRTPMQWSGDRNAGFSDANPQRLFLPLVVDDEYHHQSIHVTQQLANPHSLLWWMKRLLAVRKRYQAFGRGDLTIVDSPNMRILAFVRRWEDQQILVVANLSRFSQYVELDLRSLEGRVPVDAFGPAAFPVIGATPYPLTLAPHAFLWLELTTPDSRGRGAALARLEVESFEELFTGSGRGDLEAILPAYVERCTAWTSGARTVLSVQIEDAIAAGTGPDRCWLTILRVVFTSGEPQRYLLPLGARAAAAGRGRPGSDTIAALAVRTAPRTRFELFDAAEDRALAGAFLHHLSTSEPMRGLHGTIGLVVPDEKTARAALRHAPRYLKRTRRGSNALMAVGGSIVLKLFRQVEEGPNPEIEMRARLDEAGFAHVPSIVAAFRWDTPEQPRGSTTWIGILQQFTRNDGEAWDEAVSAARAYLTAGLRRRQHPPAPRSLVPAPSGEDLPAESGGDEAGTCPVLGPYLRTVGRIGECTAGLHRALGSATSDPAFAPEAFSPFSRRSAYQRMRRMAVTALDALQTRGPALDPGLRELAQALALRRADLLAVFRPLLDRPVTALRIRCHGNFHLGQVLRAGDDLVIIDFNGEPGRPLYERRLKHSTLHDVAIMVRSFHYAAHVALARLPHARREDPTALALARAWQARAGTAFVEAYTASMRDSPLLPGDAEERRILLHANLVERAAYEIGFELSRGSAWVRAPLLDLPLLLSETARRGLITDLP